MKKTKILALALAMTMAGTSAVCAATVPADVVGTKSESAIKTLIEEGVITGDTDGSFHPAAELTRAQACIMIVKAIDPQASQVNGTATQAAAKSGFSDMRGYGWAEGYISYAVANKIVKGYPDGTFKPAANVSTNEMLTMVLRAAGNTDDKVGSNWPADHIAKAKELGVLTNIDEDYPAKATKEMAAQMVYNQLSQLKSMAKADEKQSQGTEKDKAENAPSKTGMVFTTASFDDNLTTFAGKKVTSKTKIYTYGLKKEFTKDLALPTDAGKYRLDTLYKFKSTKTPAWYLYDKDEEVITEMILPMDVGFTGNAYCVINGTVSDVNADGEAVTGFETLTATKAITWFGEKNLAAPALNAGDGELYEIHLSDGQATKIGTATTAHRGKKFEELTTAHGWTDVTEYSSSVMTLDSGDLVAVRSNASVYVWDDKKNEYRSGSLSSIRAGKQVRAYDVSDNDETEADVVVVK